MQAEQIRIKERNHREREKLLRNIADHEVELQDEMFREFDQSTFNVELQGFHNNLFITPNYLSDCSQVDTDPSFYLSNAVTDIDSPCSRPKLKHISDRIKTPARIRNIFGALTVINHV